MPMVYRCDSDCLVFGKSLWLAHVEAPSLSPWLVHNQCRPTVNENHIALTKQTVVSAPVVDWSVVGCHWRCERWLSGGDQCMRRHGRRPSPWCQVVWPPLTVCAVTFPWQPAPTVGCYGRQRVRQSSEVRLTHSHGKSRHTVTCH